MAIDYRKLKTPYFRIKIGSAKARNPKLYPKDWYTLPASMLRLVESVEVYEALFTPEYDDFAKIVIKFIAGSREPLPIGAAASDSASIFKKANNVFLSNNSSALLDIPIKDSSGGTLFDTSRFPEKLVTIETSDSGSNRTEVVSLPTAPKYLLQERNAVEVTFGYLEEPNSKRVATGYIAIIQSEFPENSSPKTTITCQMRPFVDQLTPIDPPVFGVTLNENNVVSIQNTPIKDLIVNLWKGLGGLFDNKHIIISNTLNIGNIENDIQITWPATDSLDQFLKKLATLNYAYYDIILHPVDKKPVLIFIKKADFESGLMLGDPNLFNYKAPGSIIKSVNFKVDFALSGVNTQLVVDQDGQLGHITSSTGKEQQSLASSDEPLNNSLIKSKEIFNRAQPIPFEEFISLDSANGINPIPFCEDTANFLKNHTQRAEYHPGRNATLVAETLASVRSAVTSNAIQLELVTIGHPFLTPGLIHLKGLGTRYSGKYRILSVSHIIDSNGYICRAQATNHALSKGGIFGLDTGGKSSNMLPDPTQAPVRAPGATDADVLTNYKNLIRSS